MEMMESMHRAQQQQQRAPAVLLDHQRQDKLLLLQQQQQRPLPVDPAASLTLQEEVAAEYEVLLDRQAAQMTEKVDEVKRRRREVEALRGACGSEDVRVVACTIWSSALVANLVGWLRSAFFPFRMSPKMSPHRRRF